MGDLATDMIGFRSGRLAVIAKAPSKNGRAMWLCECDCGNLHVAMGKYLRKLQVKSCGCLNRQGIDGPANFKHGHSAGHILTSTYRSWAGMLSRCRNPNNPKWYRYGGRKPPESPILVCKRWYEFANFLKDMHERPANKTIHRINNDGHYSCGKCEECLANGWPANCKWADSTEQAGNTSKLRMLKNSDGRIQSLTAWARELGISPSTLHVRLKTMTVEGALMFRSLRSGGRINQRQPF
jgi:hypothetical protein